MGNEMASGNQVMAQDRNSDEIDLRVYIHVLSKHKWGIASLVFAVSLLTTLVLFSMQPVFKSRATLLIESESANVVSIEEVYGLSGANREYYQTQFEILKSRLLAEKVIARLKLQDHEDFNLKKKPLLGFSWRSIIPEDWQEKKEATEADKLNSRISIFSDHLSVSPVRNSQLVHVAYESHDPDLTAAVANALADEYINSQLEARLQMTQKASSWLTERLAVLRKNLDDSEQKLQDYIEQEKLVDVKGVKSLTAKRLDEITSRLVDARRERAQAEVLYRQVQRARGKGGKLSSLPAVLSHELVQNLKFEASKADRKVSELSKRYGPKHPKMIEAKSDLRTVKNNLYHQIQNVISGVEREYEVTRENVAALEREMSSSTSEVKGINKKRYQLGILQREVNANKQLYDLFLTRFKETNESSGMDSANARVVDPAVVPSEPFKPKKKLILLISALLSGMLGVLLAFVYEHLDNTIKNSADVEEKLGLPVLGILQKLKVKGKRDRSPLRAFADDDQTMFAETVRTIRTGVLLSNLDEKKKIVVVTSSVPGEGKSTVAMNLANALANMGNVLLIDADMRRPSVGQACELDARAKGLSQFTAGTAKISDAVHPIPGEKLHVMPAGIVPPNPLELLSSHMFEEAIEKLSQAFDHIVIDSAPALAVSDSLVISRYANAVIYVVQADATPSPMAQSGIKRLRQVGAPLLGVVLNKVEGGKKKQYGYGYYGDYYAGYASEQD